MGPERSLAKVYNYNSNSVWYFKWNLDWVKNQQTYTILFDPTSSSNFCLAVRTEQTAAALNWLMYHRDLTPKFLAVEFMEKCGYKLLYIYIYMYVCIRHWLVSSLKWSAQHAFCFAASKRCRRRRRFERRCRSGRFGMLRKIAVINGDWLWLMRKCSGIMGFGGYSMGCDIIHGSNDNNLRCPDESTNHETGSSQRLQR